jgi:hypothetical protein
MPTEATTNGTDTVRREMSDLLLSVKDHAHAVLKELATAENHGVAPTSYVQEMQGRGVTAEDAVSVLQDMIADGELELTNRYRVRVL